MGALAGLAQTGVAAARKIAASMHAQEAARQLRDDDFDFQSDGGDFHSVAGASDSIAIEDAQQLRGMRMQIHDQDMEDARDQRKREAIAMVEITHPKNPFDDGGGGGYITAHE